MLTPDLLDQPLLSPPTSREDLAVWLATTLGITFPTHTCPHHHSPLDYLAHAFLETDDPADAAVWACRGGGKTFLGALATLLDLLFKPGIQIRILGGSLEQSNKMYTYLQKLFESEKIAHTLARTPTRRRLELANGSVAEILAQSDRSVRGTRIQKLRCDEAELFDPDVWSAAQLTTRSIQLPQFPLVRGTVDALSTMHIPNGLMQKLLSDSPHIAPGSPGVNVPNAQGSQQAVCMLPPPQRPEITNPPSTRPRKIFTWCLWDVISQCHDDRQCATCSIWSDCQGRAKTASGFLPVADAISMHARVSRTTWEHEMLCHPPVLENAVFPSFRRSLHVRPWPLDRQADTAERITLPDRSFSAEKLIAGVDFGYTGAFVALWIQMLRDPSGRRVAWVVDELFTQQRTLQANVNTMKTRSPSPPIPHSAFHLPHSPWSPAIVYCDAAGRSTNSHSGHTDEHLLRTAGFKVLSRPMHIAEGIALIDELLNPADSQSRPPDTTPDIGHLSCSIRHSPPRLLIDPRCHHLITALENYHRHPTTGEIQKDNIHDHPLDALRYALVNHDQRPTTKVEVRNY